MRGRSIHSFFFAALLIGFFPDSIAQETPDTIKTKELTGVTVQGRSSTESAKEQAIKATVVNTREAYQQSVTLTELINRSPGVRIRQAGGLGAGTDVSVNGFQGKAIRYLKDGIPVDYLRDGFSIASIPVNTLERVEIYRGVLPVSLGVDALGGAINLVSRRVLPRYLAASYELSSFNTHRLTFNGYYTNPDKKWFLGTDVFFNHSDNDYKVRVKVTDPVTSNQFDARVPLFHNRFTNWYGELYAGLSNRKWADELRFSLAAFDLKREQNHPALMTDPYGAVLGRQSSVVPSLRYKKTLFQERLQLDYFLVHNVVNIGRTDTISGRYDWYGNFYYIPDRVGESRQAALSDIDYTNTTSRAHIKYTINEKHSLELNHVYTSLKQEGTDPLGPRLDGTELSVISLPAVYKKLVTGLGFNSSFLNDRLETSLIAKSYYFRSSGIEAWQSRAVTQADAVIQSGSNWGTAVAVKYKLSDFSFLRVSAELANRLPDQEELFGDGIWTVPSFGLSPERSFNLNLGYRSSNKRKDLFEVNAFYRRTRDLILLVPVQSPYAQFQNVRNVKGFGIDLDGSYNINSMLSVNGNLTWQDIRLFKLQSPTDQWQQHARLRNTPYFFSNAGVTAGWSKLLRPQDHLKVYSYYSFVREYYLETIPKRLEAGGFLGLFGSSDIQTSLIIPDQHFLTAGFAYAPSKAVALIAELKNILDHDLYDNYRVQKAGRSIHFKITYTIQ